MAGLALAVLLVSLMACAHTATPQGAVSAATRTLRCDVSQLRVTEYATNQATVEGCGRQGHFDFLHGRWHLYSRCEVRTTPSIPSCCSPNRGGERTCVSECQGYEACAASE